jgi:TolA-binding protein
MKKRLLIAMLAAVMLAGCSSGDKKAAELLDTAVFEEKQNNFEHAGKLYDEILKKYPGTQAARDAETRQTALKSRKP